MICKHCRDTISSWNAVPNHKCFINQDVYTDKNDPNVLFNLEKSSPENNQSIHNAYSCSDAVNETFCTEKENINNTFSKQSAIWNKQSTLALLSLYEMNLSKADNAKKKTKIWISITEGLKELGINMTSDQIRWKINSLIKKYKECVDNNLKSGRAHMTFEFYDQLEEILGQGKEATVLYTVSSKILSDNDNSNSDKRKNFKNPLNQKRQKEDDEINRPSTCAIQDESPSVGKRLRPGHGTGSNLARTKTELQTQWLDYLKTIKKREEEQTERHEKLLQKKKEIINVKKRQLDIKKQIAEKKIKSKERRHEDIIEIKKLKINLLKKLLRDDKSKRKQEDTDSD